MTNKKQVFFIGDVALDEYYSAPYFPKIKDKVLVQTLPPEMGGMIANAACVYASYGAEASFLAALNSGEISRKLCGGLKDAGLDTTHMVWDDTLPDSKTIIILAEKEHTVFIPTMNIQTIELPDAAFAALCASHYLYSTFCELRPLRHKGLDVFEVLDKVKLGGCKLWCDLDVADIREDDERFFEYVDTLFINETGYERLAARTPNAAVSEWLFAKGIQMLIVTKSSEGCGVFLPGHAEIAVPGVRVPVVDVTGAGDTFCSSFLYAHTRTDDVMLCAEFANYAAARAVAHMGPRAGAAGVVAVLDFIKANEGDHDNFSFLL